MKNMSQDVLCSLDLPSHPALMKEFYNDLSNGNNGIYGIVRVRTLKIDKEILERTLHMSTNSIVPTGLVDKEATIRLIIGETA